MKAKMWQVNKGRELSLTEEKPVDEQIEYTTEIVEPEKEKSVVNSALGLDGRTLKAKKNRKTQSEAESTSRLQNELRRHSDARKEN
jgi:hypothetical protein